LLPIFVLTTLLGWYWSRHFRWEDEGQIIKGSPLSHLWPYATFTVNYYNLIKHDFGAAATLQAWTLCVIVHFYVVLALVVAGIAAVGRRVGVARAVRVLPWLVAAAFAIGLAGRWHNAPAGTYKYDPYANYFETHLRIDECMFGVLLAYWAVFCRPTFERVIRVLAWPLVAIAVAMYAVMMFRPGEAPRWLVIWGYTAAGVTSGGLIAVLWWWEQRSRHGVVKAAPAAVALVARPFLWVLAWVGVWSYAIYLSHQPLIEKTLSLKAESLIARHLLSWKSPYLFSAAMIAYVSMAIAFGALLYFVVEWPARVLRDHWFAKRPHAVRRDGEAAVDSPFVTAAAATAGSSAP
jgi:peptidoglycan/LPS O-acetylase OafA/YrhL